MNAEINELIVYLSRSDRWHWHDYLRTALHHGLVEQIAIRHEEIEGEDGDRRVTTTNLVLRPNSASNPSNGK